MAKKIKSNAVSLRWAQNHPGENAARRKSLGLDRDDFSDRKSGSVTPSPTIGAPPKNINRGSGNDVGASSPAVGYLDASMSGASNPVSKPTPPLNTNRTKDDVVSATVLNGEGYNTNRNKDDVVNATVLNTGSSSANPFEYNLRGGKTSLYENQVPGGKTTQEMLETYNDQTKIKPYTTGFDYSQLGADAPTFTNTYIQQTGHAFAGYYLNVNGDMKWYPINDKTLEGGHEPVVIGPGGRPRDKPTKPPEKPEDSKGKGAYSVEGAPSWWTGTVIKNPDERQQQANLLNASIPFMSQEDQQSAVRYLAANFKAFAHYKNIAFTDVPTDISAETRDRFTTRTRTNQFLDTLQALSQALGKTESQMGKGYTYLKNVASIMSQFGGGEVGTEDRQTREQYTQMMTQLTPYIESANAANSKLGFFGSVAENLYNPTFSAGNLWNITKNTDGTYNFGSPSGNLY